MADAPFFIDLSKHVPLLLLEVTDDHGWGYDLLNDGRVVGDMWVNYELQWSIAEETARTRYPQYDGDLIDKIVTGVIPFDDIQQQVAESELYHAEIDGQYANMNLDELAAFEVSPETIAELAAVLTHDAYLDDKFSQIGIFKKKLELIEFNWISYRYLSRDPADGSS